MKNFIKISTFWQHAFAIRGSITPKVAGRVAVFGSFAAAVELLTRKWPDLILGIGPIEVSGAMLGILLVVRTNAGYDRWWEARKLWGGIVNQSRNLAISALAFGPSATSWQERFIGLNSAFCYVARSSLRGERKLPELIPLLGVEQTRAIESAQHMPSRVAYELALELKHAKNNLGLDGYSFLQIDKERALLIDYIGACERILKTPLPYVFSIKIRRFILMFLLLLPFALASRLDWLTPLVQMFVAYPLLSLDQIGEELQNPFAKENICHLPLDDISKTIEGNLMGILDTAQNGGTPHLAACGMPGPLPSKDYPLPV